MVSVGAVTVCNFVSRSSVIVSHRASGSEAKTRLWLSQVGLRNQAETHNGLKSFNKLDVLWKIRTPAATAVCRTASWKIVSKQGLNLVFVDSEIAPWRKTTGVRDVLGELPSAMTARGHRVMTIAPRKDRYNDYSWDTDATAEIKVGDQISNVRLFHSYNQGVDQVFVDHPIFWEKVWGKTKSKLYGPKTGVDYEDNQLGFSLLCQAALMAPLALNLDSHKYFSEPYREDVVFFINDWHTALLPSYLETMYQPRGVYKGSKFGSSIHNFGNRGRFGFSDFSLLNLPDEFRSSFDFTDSPYYAQERIPGRERGDELNFTATGTGISKGMDVQEWNPIADRDIPSKFNGETVAEEKAVLKENLQAEVRLPVDRNIPLIGLISSLKGQKGSDILAAAISEFIQENVQLVVLGTGRKYFEQLLEELEMEYPDKVRGVPKFDVPLAHRINAAADFLIIPSRFCWE